MESDVVKLLEVGKVTAENVGDFLKNSTPELVSSEGKDTKITSDVDAHTMILSGLEQFGIDVISEEDVEHSNVGSGLHWIVDPLDGSINFIRGIPNCVVSIALYNGDEPVFGIIYDFNRDEMYSGIVGEGVWLNDKEIFVSNIQKKEEAIIMTGFPSYTDYSTETLEKHIRLVQSFKKVRMIGSAALSLAYVACGRADAYYEKDIKIWDVAAGLALVSAAGGVYTLSPIHEKSKKCTVVAGSTQSLVESVSSTNKK